MRDRSPAAGLNRIPALDGVRGVAICLVLAYNVIGSGLEPGEHSHVLLHGLDHLVEIGWSGVTLFFVLSGYLIGRILLCHRDAPNYFTVFYLRRACRILPLYLALIAPLALVPLLDLNERMPALAAQVSAGEIPAWWYLTFLQNIGMVWQGSWGERWLATTWSLAVEEQFYILAAFLLRWVPLARLLPLLVGAILFSPLLRLALLLWTPPSVAAIGCYTLLPARWDALAFGLLVAACSLPRPVAPVVAAWIHRHGAACFAATTVLVLVLWALGPDPLGPLVASAGHTLLAAWFGFALWLVVGPRQLRLGFLQWRWLRVLGVTSYGIYLFHEPMVSFVTAFGFGRSRHWVDANDGLILALGIALTIMAAGLSWRFLEQPIVRFGHGFAYRAPSPRATAAGEPAAAGIAET